MFAQHINGGPAQPCLPNHLQALAGDDKQHYILGLKSMLQVSCRSKAVSMIMLCDTEHLTSWHSWSSGNVSTCNSIMCTLMACRRCAS
jgi:hypothetical protein